MIIDFGIPDLDCLLGRGRNESEPGISYSEGETLSICIYGPDGSGKSVLALHLASRYVVRHQEAAVLYFSEDLVSERAKEMYEDFGLDLPKSRCEALRIPPPPFDLDLAPMDEAGDGSPGLVSFVDLRMRSAGDDWAFLLKRIAKLPRSAEGGPACVVIDNVDALQLVNAGVDQFGEQRSRWNRVDQLMNLARGRCHVVLLSGEPGPGQVLDEQYASDFVLKLFSEKMQVGYERRMMKVEKARGQVNVGGYHSFVIRPGEMMTTGYQENPDVPRVTIMRNGSEVKLAHIRVYHSLDYTYSRYQRHPYRGYVPGVSKGVRFCGLKSLNDLLPPDDLGDELSEGSVRGGAVCALVGPRQTHKGHLVSSFEAGALEVAVRSVGQAWDAIRRLAGILDELEAERTATDENLARAYFDYRAAAEALVRREPGPVLVHLPTADEESWQVAARIAEWIDLPGAREIEGRKVWTRSQLAHIEARVICRRLEIQANSPESLYAMIRDCVDRGLRLAFGLDWSDEITDKLRKEAGERVAVAIGDWSHIEERQPEVAKNTQILPLLMFHLRRQGVTTLMTESRSDTSGLPSVFQNASRLAQDADQVIYTWRVPGDSRTAITAAPQRQPDGRALVRELRRRTDGGLLVVDAALERYEGFESGRPRPVKLQLRLLGQTPAQVRYVKEIACLLRELSYGEDVDAPLVESAQGLEYDLLRDVTELIGGERLSSTHLVMLDEFWTAKRSLLSLKNYMQGPPPMDSASASFFDEDGGRAGTFMTALGKADQDPFRLNEREPNRVPFVWDYGFLLVRPDAWRAAYEDGIVFDPSLAREKRYRVHAYVELLRFLQRASPAGATSLKKYQPDRKRSKEGGLYGRPGIPQRWEENLQFVPNSVDLLGWRVFLENCCLAARATPALKLRPFDIDLTARETLTATILEIWFSELPLMKSGKKDLLSFGKSAPGCGPPSFTKILAHAKGRLALYFALRLLSEVLEMDMVMPEEGGFDIAPRKPFPATAVRHWYSTAVRAVHEDDSPGFLAVRLPGYYSTRGDWHLGMLRGSKSWRLGHDALDLLASPRANFDRLQKGVGLPTRSLPRPEYIGTALETAGGSKAISRCSYQNLRSLGETGTGEFFWLFRSTIPDYRRQSTVLRKWACRILREFIADRTVVLSGWRSTFEIYDQYHRSAGNPSEPEGYSRFVKDHVEPLLAMLADAKEAEDDD